MIIKENVKMNKLLSQIQESLKNGIMKDENYKYLILRTKRSKYLYSYSLNDGLVFEANKKCLKLRKESIAEHELYNKIIPNTFKLDDEETLPICWGKTTDWYLTIDIKTYEEEQNVIKEREQREINRQQEELFKINILNNFKYEKELEIAKNLFLSKFENYSNFNSLKITVYCILNKSEKLCKNKLIEIMHNGNPTSKNLFEILTNIKLPKTDKETFEIIRSF
jgi:hypothetical protein